MGSQGLPVCITSRKRWFSFRVGSYTSGFVSLLINLTSHKKVGHFPCVVRCNLEADFCSSRHSGGLEVLRQLLPVLVGDRHPCFEFAGFAKQLGKQGRCEILKLIHKKRNSR